MEGEALYKVADLSQVWALAARYGIGVMEVQEVIKRAIGGEKLTTAIEGRQRFPVRVRYARDLRDRVEEMRRLFVPAMSGLQVPLAQVAEFKVVMGPAMISSENSLLQALVLMNVRGRELRGAKFKDG